MDSTLHCYTLPGDISMQHCNCILGIYGGCHLFVNIAYEMYVRHVPLANNLFILSLVCTNCDCRQFQRLLITCNGRLGQWAQASRLLLFSVDCRHVSLFPWSIYPTTGSLCEWSLSNCLTLTVWRELKRVLFSCIKSISPLWVGWGRSPLSLPLDPPLLVGIHCDQAGIGSSRRVAFDFE